MALHDALIRFRNRLLTDPRFLSFVQRLPLGPLIARRKSVELFDILAGFTYSQVLSSCVSLGLFERVGTHGITVAEWDRLTGLPPQRSAVLLKAATALGLFQQTSVAIHLGAQGAALLAQPWIMRFVEHNRHLYRDLEEPVELLRNPKPDGHLRRYWPYEDGEADKSHYSALMAASQAAVSQQILAAYDFSGHRRLLDVGGGSGAFLRAVGARHAQLDLHLFDLPGVVALAPAAPRLTCHGGSFRSDALPEGMDIVSLVRVVHDHDDDTVLALFRSIRKALGDGAVLLIAEPFAGTRHTARVTDAYFNLYFTAMGQGRTRTPGEIAAMAAGAGFGDLRQWPTAIPLISGVMTLRAK